MSNTISSEKFIQELLNNPKIYKLELVESFSTVWREIPNTFTTEEWNQFLSGINIADIRNEPNYIGHWHWAPTEENEPLVGLALVRENQFGVYTNKDCFRIFNPGSVVMFADHKKNGAPEGEGFGHCPRAIPQSGPQNRWLAKIPASRFE